MLKQDMSPSDKFLENHPNLLNYTHNILSKRKYTFLFPRILEAHFVAKRALESQAFINTGRILLILLFLIIVANVTLYYQHIVLQNNYQIIKQTYIPLSLAITFILFSPFINYVRSHFYYFMAPCSIFILYHIIILTLQYGGDYSDFVVYHLMMAIILMAFGLRFVLPLFCIVLTTAGLLGVIYAHIYNIPINFAKFSNYYILYCLVVRLCCTNYGLGISCPYPIMG